MTNSLAGPEASGSARMRRGRWRRSRFLVATAGIAVAALTFTTTGLLTASAKSTAAKAAAASTTAKPRVVITTDGEQDDQNTMVHYLMYSDEFDTVGLIYGNSQFHWAGDGNGTTFAGDCGATATSCRWNGTSWIQTQLAAYAQEYKNLKSNDPNYPTPASLMNVVRVGNIDFPGEMSQDTDGSNLIKSLILDNKPGPLYLEAWGGLNTITRALDSIQLEYQNTPQWAAIYNKVSTKVIIEASGLFQDAPFNLETSYIAPNWPRIQVDNLAGGYPVSSYPKIAAQPAENQLYYSGAWMKANIVDQGPLGALTYTYNHGPETSLSSSGPWGGTANPDYTYVSDGDDVAFLPLINTGLNNTNPAVASPDPTYGGWGGRLVQQTISPNLFVRPIRHIHQRPTARHVRLVAMVPGGAARLRGAHEVGRDAEVRGRQP